MGRLWKQRSVAHLRVCRVCTQRDETHADVHEGLMQLVGRIPADPDETELAAAPLCASESLFAWGAERTWIRSKGKFGFLFEMRLDMFSF